MRGRVHPIRVGVGPTLSLLEAGVGDLPPAESLPLTSCACCNLPRKHIASQALGRVRVGVRVGVRDRDRVRVRVRVR